VIETVWLAMWAWPTHRLIRLSVIRVGASGWNRRPPVKGAVVVEPDASTARYVAVGDALAIIDRPSSRGRGSHGVVERNVAELEVAP
jgi:hypothetical protein